MKGGVALLAACLLPVLLLARSYSCVFEKYNQDLITPYLKNHPNPTSRVPSITGRLLSTPSTTNRQAMRIHLVTTPLNTVIAGINGASSTTTTNLNHILNALSVSENFFETRLKVEPMAGNVIAPTTCVDISPPSSDTSTGIAGTELIIYADYITDAN